jgi:hypothetical protein
MPKVIGKPASKPTFKSVWEGPESSGPQGGITQSLLSKFICCRERFRLRVIEGLDSQDTFRKQLEYGQMWHTCEEAHAANKPFEPALQSYVRQLTSRYRTQQDEVIKWYEICRRQFPEYVKYWAAHPDVKDRTPLLQEVSFNVPYKLPSGRVAYLRGKWDSVDLIGKGKAAVVMLQENKTKGDIEEQQIKRQLSFDLQTMMYLVALAHSEEISAMPNTLGGVRYNVIRRPLSGGKGSIKQLSPSKSNPTGETLEHYYERLMNDYIRAEPEYWFMRWTVNVTPQDIAKFKHEFLNPCLEALCDWWAWISSPAGQKDPFADAVHYRTPFGIYSPLAEGGSTEVDEYLLSKSELGLVRNAQLFGELA